MELTVAGASERAAMSQVRGREAQSTPALWGMGGGEDGWKSLVVWALWCCWQLEKGEREYLGLGTKSSGQDSGSDMSWWDILHQLEAPLEGEGTGSV